MLFRRLASRRFDSCRTASRSLLTLALCALPLASARAATLQVAPAAPQPGDVLTLTIVPATGETIQATGMSAFDTGEVKFYRRADGSARAFVGLPFDRTGGKFSVSARVQVEKGGKSSEQVLRANVNARTRAFPRQNIRMRNGNEAKMDQKSKLRAEKLHVQSKMKNSYASPLWVGNWLVPCKGRDVSSYGVKRTVNGKPWGQHNGGDIRASSGTPVQASNTGRVVLSEYLPDLRGNCIVIDHGCNVFSIYMHLSKRLVSEGQSVGKGQRIGLVGATGFVTGPHLHWEMRIGWEPVDPFLFARRGLQF